MGKAVLNTSEGRYDITMRSRVLFFALLLCIAGAFIAPHAAQAATIPFFGPIVPKDCPAGWGLLVTVINNIIIVLLSIAIVFFAPLMIAYAGFLFVVNPVNASGKEKAKQILLHTIVGIIVSLAAWMIVAAIMVALYHPESTGWGAWTDLIGGSSADDCLKPSGPGTGAPPTSPPPSPPIEPVACTISPLSPITDRLALQMEDMRGDAVIWDRTNPRLQTCVNTFITKLRAGGERNARVTSAYRPQAYQTHLWEIHDRWCTQGLKSNTNTECYQLKSDVLREVSTHGLSACGAVGATSRHTAGTGVDIAGIANPGSDFQRSAARASCLDWKNYPDDPYHYDLMISCTCQ